MFTYDGRCEGKGEGSERKGGGREMSGVASRGGGEREGYFFPVCPHIPSYTYIYLDIPSYTSIYAHILPYTSKCAVLAN